MAGATIMQEPAYDTRLDSAPDRGRFERPDPDREQAASRRRRLALALAVIALTSYPLTTWVRSARPRGWGAMLAAVLLLAAGILQVVLQLLARSDDDKGPYSSPPNITR